MPHSHQTVKLTIGRHRSPEAGVCVMELASMLADEPFSDHPSTVAPRLASVLRACNDGLDERRRQGLKRFAALAIGTSDTRAAEKERRALLEAFLAVGDAPGWWGRFRRHVDSGDPYVRIREVCRDVAARDDEPLHRRLLELVDRLVDAGREAPASRADELLCAPAAAPCPHPCDSPTT